MAENNLNNDPNVSNFLSSLNAAFSAFRGTFAPRNNAGDVGDKAADLGSATNNWDRRIFDRLVAGGIEVDLASVAVSAAIYVFDADDASFAWPGSQTKCLLLRFRALREVKEISPGTGTDGGATTVTIGGVTFEFAPMNGCQRSWQPSIYGWGNTASGLRIRFRIQRAEPESSQG